MCTNPNAAKIHTAADALKLVVVVVVVLVVVVVVVVVVLVVVVVVVVVDVAAVVAEWPVTRPSEYMLPPSNLIMPH